MDFLYKKCKILEETYIANVYIRACIYIKYKYLNTFILKFAKEFRSRAKAILYTFL